MMGRVKTDLLDCAEDIGDRVIALGRVLEKQRVWGRIIDQVVGAGTSIGANLFEADEALSTKDWLKSVGIVLKELAETRYWLRRIARQRWVKPERLTDLERTSEQLRTVLGRMVVNTKRINKARTATKR
jgi:four helix bundle protein